MGQRMSSSGSVLDCGGEQNRAAYCVVLLSYFWSGDLLYI